MVETDRRRNISLRARLVGYVLYCMRSETDAGTKRKAGTAYARNGMDLLKAARSGDQISPSESKTAPFWSL